jgi:hypothetical protein
MKRITMVLVLLLVGNLLGVADAAPKPKVRLRPGTATGCGELPETQTCISITVIVTNYVPDANAVGELSSHATKKGPAVFTHIQPFFTESDGTRTFTFGSTPCDEDAPWWSFDLTEPVPVESQVRKLC